MFLFLTLFLQAASADPSDLSIEVRGLTTNAGAVLCTLYDSVDTWLSDPGYVATVSTVPENVVATCVFPAVVPGVYAIAFIHDENGNGDMDSNFFGLPKEPWGMSRDAPARFGPPSFEAASFTHPVLDPLIAHGR